MALSLAGILSTPTLAAPTTTETPIQTATPAAVGGTAETPVPLYIDLCHWQTIAVGVAIGLVCGATAGIDCAIAAGAAAGAVIGGASYALRVRGLFRIESVMPGEHEAGVSVPG